MQLVKGVVWLGVRECLPGTDMVESDLNNVAVLEPQLR